MENLIKGISEWLYRNSDAISPSMSADRVRKMLLRPFSTVEFHHRELGEDCTVYFLGESCFVVKVDSNPTGIDHKLTASLEEAVTLALTLRPATAAKPRKSENQIKPGHVQVVMSFGAIDHPELRATELCELHADEGVFRVADGITVPTLNQYGDILVPRKAFWRLFVTAAPEIHDITSVGLPTFPSGATLYNAPRDGFIDSSVQLLVAAACSDEGSIAEFRQRYRL